MRAVALVVGEALVDVVRQRDGSLIEYAGGSAANVAVALSRLERPVMFATAFTDDRYGKILRSHLDRAEVGYATDPNSIDHSSSAIATIGEDGSASYVFDLEWRLNPLTLIDAQPVAVHTSSLAAVLAPGCDDVLSILRQLSDIAVISYDVNVRPSITGTGAEVVAAVERVAAVADIVKASDEDLAALYPAHSIAEAARHLLGLGAVIVVVTRGDEGALWMTTDAQGEVAAVSVVVADTIGAGDTFGAAFIDVLWTRGLVGPSGKAALAGLGAEAWTEICAYAARAAAINVSRPGADPPYKHELG